MDAIPESVEAVIGGLIIVGGMIYFVVMRTEEVLGFIIFGLCIIGIVVLLGLLGILPNDSDGVPSFHNPTHHHMESSDEREEPSRDRSEPIFPRR